MTEEEAHFGEHLMIDGYGGDPVSLDNRDIVLRCLTELPAKLGMRALADATIYSAPDNGIKDPGGWSGYVVIAESHVSVHTFTKRGFVSVDVYTCRNGLDVEMVKSYVRDAFGLKKLEVNFVKRGKEYPKQDIHAS